MAVRGIDMIKKLKAFVALISVFSASGLLLGIAIGVSILVIKLIVGV